MTAFYFLVGGIVIGIIIGIAHGLDMREHSHEIDLPSAWQRRQWERARLIRDEPNRWRV